MQHNKDQAAAYFLTCVSYPAVTLFFSLELIRKYFPLFYSALLSKSSQAVRQLEGESEAGDIAELLES